MDKILSYVGLAKRAGKIIIGETLLKSFSSGKVKFVFIAADASDKTKERFLKKCHYYSLNYNDQYTSNDLSLAIGKGNIKVVGICDEGFQKLIEKEGGFVFGKTSTQEK